MTDIEATSTLRGEARFTVPEGEPGPERAQQRKTPRCEVDLEVTLQSEHNFYAGFLENLSAGGLFIATHIVKPRGATIDFTIRVPGFDEPIRGTGEVRWVREYSESSDAPPGMGIRFLNLLGNSCDVIRSFLQARDPMFWDE